MTESRAVDAKKRLMFVKGEDFYFLAYNIILILHNLRCTAPSKPFKDHRKLAFLVDFASDPRLMDIVQRHPSTNGPLNPRDRQELLRAYTDGAARIHLVTRLICAMEVRGLLHVERAPSPGSYDVFLREDMVPKDFMEAELYEQEHKNIAALLQTVSRVRTLSLATTLERLFNKCGVQTWHA